MRPSCGNGDSDEEETWSSVGLRIVEILDGPGSEIASNARNIELQMSIVAPGHKRCEQRMPRSRLD